MFNHSKKGKESQIIRDAISYGVFDNDFVRKELKNFNVEDMARIYATKGSNGEANVVNTGAASTFAAAALACVGAADTIDVKVDGAAAATGRLRVYAIIADVSAAHTEAAVASRDLV